MIRVVTFLLAVAVLAAGFVWFADRPGDRRHHLALARSDLAGPWSHRNLGDGGRACRRRAGDRADGALDHRARHLAFARAGVAAVPPSPRRQGPSRDLARADRHRRRRSARRAQVRRGGGEALAGPSACSAAHRAIGADGRRPQRRRARLPRDDAARGHQAARLARALHRSAAARRRAGRAARRRGSRQGHRRRPPGPDRRCSIIAVPLPTGRARSTRSIA